MLIQTGTWDATSHEMTVMQSERIAGGSVSFVENSAVSALSISNSEKNILNVAIEPTSFPVADVVYIRDSIAVLQGFAAWSAGTEITVHIDYDDITNEDLTISFVAE